MSRVGAGTLNFETGSAIGGQESQITSTSSFNGWNMLSLFQSSITTFIIALQEKKRFKSYYYFFWILFVNIYLCLTSISMPNIDPFKYGEYGKWVFQIVNYPITFSISLIPYEGTLALLFIFLAVSLIHIGLLVFAFKEFAVSSKRAPKWKKISFFFNHFMIIGGMFMIYTMSSLIDCDFIEKRFLTDESSESTYVLKRYPSIGCFDTNLIFYVISIIGSLLVCVSCVLSILIVSNSHPLHKSWFTMETSTCQAMLLFFNCFGIFINAIIPNSYAYIRGAVHVLFSLIWIVSFALQIPFFTRIENSIYFGVGFAKLGSSIGAIISYSISNPFSYTIDEKLALYTMGVTLGLVVVGFIFGFLIMEIYSRIIMLRVHKLLTGIDETNVEKTNAAYTVLEEKGMLRSLTIYFRCCVRHSNPIAETSAKAIAALKGFNNPGLMLTTALYISYSWEEVGHTYGLYLIRGALKPTNSFTMQFHLYERMREIEIDQSRNSKTGQTFVEIKHTLDKMRKQEEELLSLHKNFFKELMNEFPNLEKLDQINRRASKLSSSLDDTYSNLMSRYSHEKTVLRNYARFVETFKLDKELSQALYQEAVNIEEDEAAKTAGKGVNLTYFTNATKSKNELLTRASSDFRKSIKVQSESEGASENGFEANEQDGFDDDIELDDGSFAGVEAQDVSKKEIVIRNALRTSDPKRIYCILFFVFALCSMILILAFFSLGIYTSTKAGEEVPFSYKVCLPTMATIGMLRHVRMQQNILEYLKLNHSIPEEVKIFYDLIREDHVSKLEKYKGFLMGIITDAHTNKFSMDTYKDFTEANIEALIPLVKNDALELVFEDHDIKNTSLVEMNNILASIGEKFIGWKNNDYNNTLQDFDFAYVWRNKLVARNAYVHFCEKNIQSSHEGILFLLDIFFIVFGCVCGSYALIFFIYLIVSRREMSQFREVLSLMNTSLSKNVVGKIYHQIGSKNDDDAAVHLPKNSLTQSRNLFLIYGALVILCVILCCGMILFESQTNLDASYHTMLNIKHGTSVLRVVHRANFRVGEYFSFLSLPKTHLNTDSMAPPEEINHFKQDIKTLLAQLFSEWNYLIYGGGEYAPSVGRYSKVDEIIRGSENCNQTLHTSNYTLLEEWKYCSGLEKMITLFSTETSQFNDQIFNSEYYRNTVSVFSDYISIFTNTNLLSDKIVSFLNLFVEYSSAPSMVMTYVFGLFGFIVTFILLCLMFGQFEHSNYQIYNLKMMLGYVPMEVIDGNEPIRSYILYNILPSTSKFKNIFNRTNQVSSHHESKDSKVRSILNGSVDGAVLCDQGGYIDLINPAAQRMFGSQQSETVGMLIETLFDDLHKDNVKKMIAELKIASTKSNEAGDTLEVECIRKNMSKFPAKINLFVVMFENSPIITCFIKDITSEKKHNAILAEEKVKSEHLLRNILPEAVAAKLKSGETFIAEKFSDITCFFSDMVGFTKLSSGLNPNELVGMLNTVVNGFDSLTDKYSLEKIKTIGDAYFCVGGIGNTQSDHPERTLRFAMGTFDVIHDFNIKNPNTQIDIRAGINTGSVIAGVIGTKKFAYDLWGDAVNTASRMESTSLAGRIQISRSTYERVHDLGFEFEERYIEVKGKGMTTCYLLNDRYHTKSIPTSEEVSAYCEINIERSSDELIRTSTLSQKRMKKSNSRNSDTRASVENYNLESLQN